MNRILTLLFHTLLTSILLTSCGVYTFVGASIPPEMTRIEVPIFDNQAPIIVPSLSQSFTEALKDRIRTQSVLTIVQETGNATLEGYITNYSIQPIAIQGNQTAGLNRLTITVFVRYTNHLDNKLSFEQSFSRYLDFSTKNQSFEQQELTLIGNINTMLAEDIFNRAFANW